MMNWLWSVMLLIGIVGAANPVIHQDAAGILMSGAVEAVSLCLRMSGGFAFWSGVIAILERAGGVEFLSKWMKFPLRALFPGLEMDGEAGRAILMNLVTNMLGMGNAATPMGIKAMRLLGEASKDHVATHAMCMFLVLNASSVQLFPGSVVALRAAVGSQAPASIVGPTLVATAVSTIVGIVACKVMAGRVGRNGG